MHLQEFLNIWLKFFFLFTPFFALSMFLSMTGEYTEQRRRRLAVMIMLAVAVLCVGLLYLGNRLFAIFGGGIGENQAIFQNIRPLMISVINYQLSVFNEFSISNESNENRGFMFCL